VRALRSTPVLQVMQEAMCGCVCVLGNTDGRRKEEINDPWLAIQEISGVVDENPRRLSAVLCALCQAERVQATTR